MKGPHTLIRDSLFAFVLTAVFVPPALPAEPGQQRWSFDAGGFIRCPAVASDGTVYVGGGKVYALKGSTGERQWEFAATSARTVVGPDDTVLAAADKLYALDGASGAKKWEYAVAGSWPAIGGVGLVYVTSGNSLHALDAATGAKRWSFTGVSTLGSPALGEDETVYVSCGNTFGIYAIAGQTGQRKWMQGSGGNYPGASQSSPVVGTQNAVYVDAFAPVGLPEDRYPYLYALGRATGTVMWSAPGAAASLGIGADGTLFAVLKKNMGDRFNPGSASLSFGALSAGTHSPLWQLGWVTGPSYRSEAPAVAADGTVYVVTRHFVVQPAPLIVGGRLTALQASTGNYQWSFGIADSQEASTSLSAPAVGPDGTVYVGCDNGTLYALEGSGSDLAASPWPKDRGNPRNTGQAYSVFPRVSKPVGGGDWTVGLPVGLRVEVASLSPVELQWRLNGQPIPGATNTTWNIPSISTNEAGAYTVAARNRCATVVSPPTVVSVTPEPPQPPAITTAGPLPEGTVGAPYTQTLAASGGTTPYTWTLADGSLPSGLDLSSGGVIQGTPETAGAASFTVQVTGSNGASATRGFSLTITLPVMLHYVALDSPDPKPPYTSWATAARNIQDAVDVAQAGAEIVVTNGTYDSGVREDGRSFTRVAVTKTVTVRSVSGPAVTVIRGRQQAGGLGGIRCVSLASGASLSGFTLTGGGTAFVKNANPPDFSGTSGGGVSCGPNTTVSNCVLVENSADGSGAGAYGGTLNNCTLRGNSNAGSVWGFGWGGGAAHSTLNHCVLTGNSANLGGGAMGCTLNNCTVTGNSAGQVGGVAGTTMNNCIVYNNTAGYGSPNHDWIERVNYSCTTPMPAEGVGNITNAPLFLDQASSNFRLQANSPCINAGNNAYPSGTKDLDGLPRVVSGTVDMGAYKFQGSGSVISYAWLQSYGLPTDGSADFVDADTDGRNTWQEWCCLTNPSSALSLLRVLSATPVDTGVTVSWPGVDGVTYFLERSLDLGASPPFTLLATNLSGPAGTHTFTDTNVAASSSGFYRVGVRP